MDSTAAEKQHIDSGTKMNPKLQDDMRLFSQREERAQMQTYIKHSKGLGRPNTISLIHSSVRLSNNNSELLCVKGVLCSVPTPLSATRMNTWPKLDPYEYSQERENGLRNRHAAQGSLSPSLEFSDMETEGQLFPASANLK